MAAITILSLTRLAGAATVCRIDFTAPEDRMRTWIVRALVAAWALAGVAATVSAQGSFFTSLSGSVVDTSGAVIPGASIRIKNNGTGEEFDTVTGADGAFSVP